MKLVWSTETASKAYIDTVKSCEKFKEFGVAELLSAMAGGWNAKLIVETWSGGPVATSIGLAIAAGHTCGRHVCIVPDERSRLEYIKAMQDMIMATDLPSLPSPPEIAVGEAETVMRKLVGLDFLVVDCKRKEFARILMFAKVSNRGAVLACKNAWERNWVSGFRWYRVLKKGTRVVKSVFLPVGQGLDIVHVGSSDLDGGLIVNTSSKRSWIKHVDQEGEEHLFRK